MPSSNKTLSGNFGKVHSFHVLDDMSQKAEKNFYRKSTEATAYSGVRYLVIGR